MKRQLPIGLFALLVGVSAACGDGAPPRDPTSTTATTEAPAPATAAPTETSAPPAESSPTTAAAAPAVTAGEQISWTPCEEGLHCGFVEVPADYSDPDAGTIRIAVNVHRAASPQDRIGYLLVNPGGPGESGMELVETVPYGAFSDEVVAHFDIIGFDPRGVGRSEPAFACGDSGEQIALLATVEGGIDTPEEIAAGEAAARLCIDSMGPVGGLLHSAYVAGDMDEIRKALGADRISYLGFSYGSALGVWYATLFPDSVRAMVVDGADNPVKPVATREERVGEQLAEAETFDSFLREALGACSDPECPIYNDGDPIGYFHEAAEKLGLVNDAAGHPHAGSLGVISTLYSQETWPDLWFGLFALNEYDDPSILVEFAAFQLGEEPGAASITSHVNCLDEWVLNPQVDRHTRLGDSEVIDAAAAELFPLLAALDLQGAEPCPFYDQFAPEPLDVPLDGGGAPILVIGNHDDPFTSFRLSEALATRTLADGYLVETSYPSHIVYPANQCVNRHVHRVLIDQSYPDERRVFCEPEG